MKNKSIRYTVEGAVIGAFYAALTLALAPISFGAIQFRISEALTILPLFTPSAIGGLTVGCIISNTIGVMTGANVAGVYDIFIGSGATLIAALCTYWLRSVKIKNLPFLSFLPPIIFNALIVGAELCIYIPAEFSLIFGIASVGLGEAVVVLVLGIPLYYLIKKTNIFNK